MKLTRVEQLFDGSRLIFYFTAEGRVDFRELVRELASEFHTRIEMRQIGARDEAKMLGGYGSCGRPLCCTTWLNAFEPVSIKMAKQQDLSLNPSRLSGLCGRLKCCLRYELPNAKGVRGGGCGDEGGCGNPTGCGTGAAAARAATACCWIQLSLIPTSLIPSPAQIMSLPASALPPATQPASDPKLRARRWPILASLRRASPSSTDPNTPFAPGVLSADAGRAAYETIVRAVRDAQAGGHPRDCHGAPSTKKRWLWRACRGGDTPRCSPSSHRRSSVAMMFWSEKLRVVLATIHIPLASVPAALTIESVSGHHRADQPRAAAIRHRASTARARGAESTRRRARYSRARRNRRARARRREARKRASTSPGRSPAIRSFCGRCEASSTRSSRAITIRD